jgi:hypothetical protein
VPTVRSISPESDLERFYVIKLNTMLRTEVWKHFPIEADCGGEANSLDRSQLRRHFFRPITHAQREADTPTVAASPDQIVRFHTEDQCLAFIIKELPHFSTPES